MESNKTSIFGNGLIWFGAAVSIAELMTGTLIAPLGMEKGIIAILLGHLIGCVLLFAAGLVGARTGYSSMQTVRISFGNWGAKFFAFMNVLQLVGWTAVMTKQGADSASAAVAAGTQTASQAADGAASQMSGFMGVVSNPGFWAVVIGLFILVWIILGVTNIAKLNTVVMAALFIMTVVMSFVVFSKGLFVDGGAVAGTVQSVADLNGAVAGNAQSAADLAGASAVDPAAADTSSMLSFGAAVELSAAMPVSWLPLISDYTRTAGKPVKATSISVIVYFIGSCWMFLIGMAASLFTGSDDIAGIMVAAGVGIIGLLIVVLSTITTTFLDAYSAGVSSSSFYGRIGEKSAAVAVTVIGTILAIFAPVNQFENFLYLIGSVFAPMIAILIADVYILKRNIWEEAVNVRNAIIWVAGFVIYRAFLYVDTPVGNTLPVIIIVIVLCIVVEFFVNLLRISKDKIKNEESSKK